MAEVAERLLEPLDEGVRYEIAFSCIIRSYTHKSSPTFLSGLKLNKDDTNKHDNLDE